MPSRPSTAVAHCFQAALTSASYNAANRLTQRVANGVTISPTWDANGSLTNDGTNAYVWDARNRLSQIGGLGSFVYDAFGRRQTATRGGTATSFLYDGWEVAQEQQSGAASANLLLGLGVDERLGRTAGGAASSYLTDRLGSTLALASGSTPAIATSYGYDAQGNSTVTGTSSTNSFQFAERENDATGLITMRNRYYNPAWGRFISEDPIGLAGGSNLYVYATNDPVTFRDPLGLYASATTPSPDPGSATPPTSPSPSGGGDGGGDISTMDTTLPASGWASSQDGLRRLWPDAGLERIEARVIPRPDGGRRDRSLAEPGDDTLVAAWSWTSP